MWGEYAWVWQDEYWRAAIILAGSAIFAKFFQMVCVSCFRKITDKTETDLDDMILTIAARPFFYLILLLGGWLGVRPLSMLEPYALARDGIFFVLSVIVVAWVVARVLVLLTTRWFMSHRNLRGSPRLMNIIVSGVVYFAAGIIILSFFNIEVTPLVAALGVGGLAVGLALQDTLGNVFAGIHIISDEPFRVRDVIEVKDEDIQGEVIDIGWRSTRIRTFKGNVVIVPNSKIANSTLTNFELPKQPMKVSVECGVDYGSDLEKVEQVSLGVARTIQKTVEGGIPDFEPILRFHTFGDSNIEFRVILEASCRGDSFVLAHEFMKELHRRFDEEGIEISWPVRKQYQLGKPPSKRVYTKRKKRKRKAVKTKRERRDEGEIGDE